MASLDQYPTHLFSYRFDGREYTVDILAKDANEAKERVKALAWARYDGVLITRIPNTIGAGLIARLAVALRNFTQTLLGHA
jgi:hypothetical protein